MVFLGFYGIRRSEKGTQIGTNQKKTGKSEQIGTNWGDLLLTPNWGSDKECSTIAKTWHLSSMMVGLLSGAGAETLILWQAPQEKHLSRDERNPSQWCISIKPRKIGVYISGAEIQALAVDTGAAV